MSGEFNDIDQELAEARALRETAVDAIITITETGLIESFNPAAETLFGYTRQQVIGRPVNDLMPEPHKANHDDYLKRYIRSGQPRIIGFGRDLEAQHESGRLVPIHLAVSEYWLGSERRFLGVVRDLSDRVRAERAERESRNRLSHAGRVSLMGEMTAGIAHEINQPLAAIAMYAQAGSNLIERDSPDMAKIRSVLEKLRDQALRAGAVIDRVQRFVKGQDGVRVTTDLTEVMTEVISIATNDAHLHDIEIQTVFEPNLDPVRCDPVQVQQVGLNLVRNAIDAMSEDGCRNGNIITIATNQSDSHVIVRVTDRGPGVPKESRADLFKPFHTTKVDGMGMGLSICRTIVDAHGGELLFEPNESGGATFFFTLPKEVNA